LPEDACGNLQSMRQETFPFGRLNAFTEKILHVKAAADKFPSDFDM
jgi:hypothetical protein